MWTLIGWELAALIALVLLCFTQPRYERSGWIVWGFLVWAPMTLAAVLVHWLGWFR